MVVGLPRDGLSPAWERDFASYTPAGVILFRRDFRDLEDLRRLTARLRELAQPRRIFVTMDEEGGVVSQLTDLVTVPPNALLLSRGARSGGIEHVARVTARRLRALGVDWVFAPVADIHSEPANPVIGPRAFGTDAATVSAAVGEVLRGFRATGLGACLKHFPGHGATTVDSHLVLPTAPPLDTLERRELVPFRENREADAVMMAHVVIPDLEPGRPATLSPAAHDLLRKRLEFRGVAITDALEMKGAAIGTPLEVTRLALEAGCDLLLFAFHDEEVRRLRLELARLLTEGGLDRTRFDEGRDRLAELDRRIPPPTADETAAALESLTPPDWETGLAEIIERGLVVSGTLPAPPAGLRIDHPVPPLTTGITIDTDLGTPLREAGVRVDADATTAVIAVGRRVPLDDDAVAALRAAVRERPTILVGLQNDAFLDQVPEAAVRISASDATTLTRRVVARRIAALIGD